MADQDDVQRLKKDNAATLFALVTTASCVNDVRIICNGLFRLVEARAMPDEAGQVEKLRATASRLDEKMDELLENLTKLVRS